MPADDLQNKRHAANGAAPPPPGAGGTGPNSPPAAKSHRRCAKVDCVPKWCKSCFSNKTKGCACENNFQFAIFSSWQAISPGNFRAGALLAIREICRQQRLPMNRQLNRREYTLTRFYLRDLITQFTQDGQNLILSAASAPYRSRPTENKSPLN